jgi:hypothetical protein
MERKEALQRVIEMAEKYRESCGAELPEPLESDEALLIVEKVEKYIDALKTVIGLAERWIDSEEAREISSREQQEAIETCEKLKINIECGIIK